MFKGLTKPIGLLLLLLLIVGSILLPAYHKAHCDHHGTNGCDSHCPICQVANTPCISSFSPVVVVADNTMVGDVPIRCSLFVAATPCNFSQARAPPVV